MAENEAAGAVDPVAYQPESRVRTRFAHLVTGHLERHPLCGTRRWPTEGDARWFPASEAKTLRVQICEPCLLALAGDAPGRGEASGG